MVDCESIRASVTPSWAAQWLHSLWRASLAGLSSRGVAGRVTTLDRRCSGSVMLRQVFAWLDDALEATASPTNADRAV